MKKPSLLNLIISSAIIFTLCGCDNSSSSNIGESSNNITTSEKLDMAPINEEMYKCYQYFMAATNYKENSKGYGLSRDRLSNAQSSSMAATGFNLGSLPIYVNEGYISKEKGLDMASKTLDTILNIQADSTTSYEGCIAHFVDMETGKRIWNSEVSTIDTAILVSGAIVAGEFFQGEILTKAETLWGNVNYNAFKVRYRGKEHISMGVKDPNAAKKEQISAWSGYAEHLMMYLLGAGNPNKAHRIDPEIYKNMDKPIQTYNDHMVIYSWFGSLFTYQFSHAFFNFNEYEDYEGTNWFSNSVEASLAAYDWCQTYSTAYKSFNENSWGLTACDTPIGYSGILGCAPKGYGPNEQDMKIMGTVSPCAALGSMPFTPELSYKALKYYQNEVEDLNNYAYGLRDAFNLDWNGGEWIAADFLGIDKGITIMQLYNYKNTNYLSNLGNQNEYIQEAFLLNGFTKVAK